jgi:phospholipase/lecithinase/hemolysin
MSDSYAGAQIAQGVLNPDAHMFVQDDVYQYDMDVVATVIAQLLLKAAALKMWGNDARLSTKAEVKQLYWRNSFEPVHHKSLTVMRLKQTSESYVVVVKKKDGTVKPQKVDGGNKQRDYVQRKIQAHLLPVPLNQFYYHVQSMQNKGEKGISRA